eukprot:CAMPEP_0185753192 /NCGR_PEP_ID=MMETSP1174-20130828/11923_1 /TAXON_ID=35687 /ORGANISM="Dictyocha speculum, Strain CCMP1381" /LENGTH=62 /DNA_ID=CAMNT_0028430921 /DNA_START=109 /DNA_END=297 /DNA_ORIENTATION=-
MDDAAVCAWDINPKPGEAKEVFPTTSVTKSITGNERPLAFVLEIQNPKSRTADSLKRMKGPS